MEEKILELLSDIDEEIISYNGDNLFNAGLLDSFTVINLVADIEDNFDIEIDAKYIVEENFKTKENIIALMKKLID